MDFRYGKLITVICLLWTFMIQASASLPAETWFSRNSQGQPTVYLHVFWSRQCPHCIEALPYLDALEKENPWLSVKRYQLVGNAAEVKRYQYMARTLGQEARSVPAFMFCQTMFTGFEPGTTADILRQRLKRCYAYLQSNPDLADYHDPLSHQTRAGMTLDLPVLGSLPVTTDSLFYVTLAIAAVDAFNPCAFFVLMFLLGMMLHSHSRRRMLLVGGIFVLFSGLLYFLFMSAWLNLFRVIGQLDVITMTAGLIALLFGVINAKDYFWFKKGVSLSIPESVKPGLYQRVRNLLRAESLSTLMLATIGLSLFANLYEFLCTAGFPMVYTRILTLNELPAAHYYLYLALYNVIYVLPLLFIVIVISFTLGGRKLQQQQGRSLKLVSGMMMLVLGAVLLIEPDILNHLGFTLALMLLAVVSAMLIILYDRWRQDD